MEFCWHNATQRVVRELGWALFSPPVLEFTLPEGEPAWRPPQDEEANHLLASLDRDPAPLRRYLEDRGDRRLGACFEALWAYFLDTHSFYRVLARNRQIHAGDKTLGALDFVIEDQLRHCVVHLELAVKYYLFLPTHPGPELERWIGPNPDDSLAIKYRHLRGHQLPLGRHPETLAALKARGIPPPDIGAAVIGGYLFSPADGEFTPGPPVNPDHPGGIWLKSQDLGRLEEYCPRRQWAVLDKTAWLDPNPPLPISTPADQVARRFTAGGCSEPQLIVGKKLGEEKLLRCFVVPNHWPATDAAGLAGGNGDPEGT